MGIKELFKRGKIDSKASAVPMVRVIDPVASPDEARLLAILHTPGVVNGTISVEQKDGTLELDFDHRDEHNNPTSTFYPK